MHENVRLNLQSALDDLHQAASQKLDPRDPIARLDEITRLAGPSLPPDLRHYLQNRSYEKARLFLQGENPEASPARCG